MPYTGYEPFGPSDYSGGGLDPSFYYAISQGGRFPGDYQNYLEYMAAQARGDAGGNPDYDVPDWLTKAGRFGKLMGWHEKNVRSGGEGQSPDLPGGYLWHFFSGPGAQFGPPGGPLHGLVDQGRPGGGTWDQDRPGTNVPPSEGKKGKGGVGGGGKKYNFQWAPTQQNMQHQASFVDWQPTQPFSGSSGPTKFVTSSLSPAAAPPANRMPGPGTPGGGQGKGKGGGGGGKGGGKNGGGQTTTPPGKTPPPGSIEEFWDWLLENSPMSGRGDAQRWGAPGPGMRGAIGGGVNPNMLDLGTPGWLRDPTADPFTTKGFPGPTPFAPNPGEGFDSYLTRLHDAGFDPQSILSMAGPYGFHQDEGTGNWQWGWGTGPVVRGPEGYTFANQLDIPGITMNPDNLGSGRGVFGLGGGSGAAGLGAGAGGNVGGGGTRNWNATAGDWLLGGVTGAPAY